MRGVFLFFRPFADVSDLLKFRPSAVTVGGGKASVLVQSFSVFQVHDLPGRGIPKCHSDIARDVLTEVDDQIPCDIAHGLTLEAFFFPHGDALIFDQRPICMLCAERRLLPAV